MATRDRTFASTGREACIVEAVRTPMGKSHPERGWYRDVHPNAMLGRLLHRAGRTRRDRAGTSSRTW